MLLAPFLSLFALFRGEMFPLDRFNRLKFKLLLGYPPRGCCGYSSGMGCLSHGLLRVSGQRFLYIFDFCRRVYRPPP